MSPCSRATSPENTICYPPSDHANCPITDIKIVDEFEAVNYYQVLGYELAGPIGEKFMIYSRFHGDNLPISTTKLDGMPCLNKDQSVSIVGPHHDLEIETQNVCTEYKGFLDGYNHIYDPRYKQLDMQISEYDLQI